MLVRDGDERTTLKEMMERNDRAYGLDMSAKREKNQGCKNEARSFIRSSGRY